MDARQFVAALRLVVGEGTQRSVLKTLEAPAGRAPARERLEMSAWYRKLEESDRAMLRRVLAHTVDATGFNFLCVLDGVSPIEEPQGRGELVLEHVGPQGRTRLNDPKLDLHDLW